SQTFSATSSAAEGNQPSLSAAPWFDRHGKKSQLSAAFPAPAASSLPARSNIRRAHLRRNTIALPFALPVAGWGWGRAGLGVPTWGREVTIPGLGQGLHDWVSHHGPPHGAALSQNHFSLNLKLNPRYSRCHDC